MEESNKKQGGNSGDVFVSPNIRSAEGEELSVSTNLDGPETTAPTVDGIPIAEENIEFRAKDIKKHDDSQLFVKVEGAEKRAREAERNKKKKDEELIKRLHTAASDHKKARRKARNEKRIAKLKATHQAIHHGVKKTAKQIHRFRFPILAVLLVIVGIIVTVTLIVPAINQFQAAQQKEADDRYVEDHKTDMINLYGSIAGKKIEISELEEITKNAGSGIEMTAYEEDGEIRPSDGHDEAILFIVNNEEGKAIANQFVFVSSFNGGTVKISGASNSFYYSCGDTVINFDSAEDAVRKYILTVIKQREES